MFFIVSKALHFLILPLNWVFGMLLLALWGPERTRRGWLIATLSVLYLYTTDFLINPIFRQWEVPVVWYKDIGNDYDAVIVLGGVSSPGKKPDDRVHFPGSPDRLMHALQLYKLGKAQKIILSGGSGELLGKRIPEADFLRRELMLCQVDSSDILLEPLSKNTRENAVFTARLVKEMFGPHPKLIVVTSAWHMRRSLGCFRKVGLEVTPFSTNQEAPEGGLHIVHFIPNPGSPLRWHALLHEWVGYMSYSLSGYI